LIFIIKYKETRLILSRPLTANFVDLRRFSTDLVTGNQLFGFIIKNLEKTREILKRATKRCPYKQFPNQNFMLRKR